MKRLRLQRSPIPVRFLLPTVCFLWFISDFFVLLSSRRFYLVR